MVSKIVNRLNCEGWDKIKEVNMDDKNSGVCEYAKSGHKIDWDNIF